MDEPARCTAFQGQHRLAAGDPCDVAVAVKYAQGPGDRPILVFDDRSGRAVDFDLRGSDEEIMSRLRRPPAEPAQPRPPGRPKLGVTAREVTLLPRHWDWLSRQRGGASVTLRRLVDAARAADDGSDRRRQAQEAADRFMRAMLGDQPGYEEAARALYQGAAERFTQIVEPWPGDLRDYARRLSAPAFADADAGRGERSPAACDGVLRG